MKSNLPALVRILLATLSGCDGAALTSDFRQTQQVWQQELAHQAVEANTVGLHTGKACCISFTLSRLAAAEIVG